jgi:GNAT superfamily N-acetyltransferase
MKPETKDMQHEEEIGRNIRRCVPADSEAMLAIINAAAQAYRGVIPDDCWHQPYFPAEELTSELADGVTFSGYLADDRLIGVMGTQRRHNVDLIRHAYVLPEWQGHGIGSRLLHHLCKGAEKPILIGTWRAADWAIRFYERHGFVRVGDENIKRLLRTYWTIAERQVATSVVLASPALGRDAVDRLIAEAVDAKG